MTQTVVLTQQLAKLQYAKALKEQVDVAQQKEAILKERIQPWLDEALTISIAIKGKLAHMQAVGDLELETTSDLMHQQLA